MRKLNPIPTVTKPPPPVPKPNGEERDDNLRDKQKNSSTAFFDAEYGRLIIGEFSKLPLEDSKIVLTLISRIDPAKLKLLHNYIDSLYNELDLK